MIDKTKQFARVKLKGTNRLIRVALPPCLAQGSSIPEMVMECLARDTRAIKRYKFFIQILGMILTFVIPKISTVFVQLNVPLPFATRAMMFMSDLVVKHTLWFGLGLAVVGSILYSLDP
jgi:hypothetical protein